MIMTAGKVCEEIANRLKSIYDKREAKNIAFLFLEDEFGIGKMQVMTNESIELDSERLEAGISRLLHGEPLQYVTGVADFYGRKFKVTPGVLIPRPETEELVQLILNQNLADEPTVLEVGVGSGCIAITLALALNVRVFGTDISKTPLSVTEENARALGAKIELFEHNILNAPLPVQNLDVLVSNPPYIPLQERKSMHQNVIDFEPKTALFVPDDHALLFYEKIAEKGRASLAPEGRLYVEIHESYGPEVKSLLENMGYKEAVIHQDMQGKNRIVSAINSTSTSL
ncbi:MAG: peptide chain release factor N(5)-glutamine methyltransferase [Bacteroidota bacterium]